MYAIVPMYFTHTYTHLYIKYTLKVLVICSICGRNWGFTFQSVIIMKTGEKFHVEKENYDRLWQSFTERLEEGKKCNSRLPCLYQTMRRAESLIPWYKKRKFYNCDNTCMCLQHLTPG